MADHTSVQYYTVPTHCGLCRFELAADDEIAVVSQTGRQAEELRYSPDLFHDNADGIYFPECRNLGHRRRAVAFHSDCAELARASDGSLLYDLFYCAIENISTYAFEPSDLEHHRRLDRLEKCLSAQLNPILHRLRLPPELRTKIVRYHLPRHVAQATFKRWQCQDTRPGRHSVTITEDIWATYTIFEGRRYIAALESTRTDLTAELIWKGRPVRPMDALYVAEDHLGIRQLLFGSAEIAPDTQEYLGAWWRTLSVTTSTLGWQTDGIKLRDVTVSEKRTDNYTFVWPTPRPIANLPIIYSLDKFPVVRHSFVRMLPLKPTTSRCMGYTFNWGCRAMSMHAHGIGEPSASYSQTPEVESGYWVSLPLDDDEYIADVWLWVRKGPLDKRHVDSLILRTNKGRTCRVGPHPTPGQTISLTLVESSNNTAGDIFFDDDLSGINFLAIDGSGRPRSRAQLHMPTPKTPSPSNLPNEEFFWTYADLKNVISVSLCRRRDCGPDSFIIGMLLHYKGGHRASVGDVRLDKLERPTDVRDSPTMWLGHNFNDPRISSIFFERPSQSGCLFLEIDFQGRLEWWYTDRQCRVYYKEQASPPTWRI